MKKLLIIAIVATLCPVDRATETDPPTFDMFVAKMNPCVIIEKDEATGEVSVSGFEIDLWKSVSLKLSAKNLIKDTKFIPIEWSQLESGMRNGEADGAASGLTIRAGRQEWSTASMPIMNSGLGIMVLKDKGGVFSSAVIMWNALKIPLLIFAIFIMVFSFIIWWMDKDDDETNDAGGFSDKFYPGFLQAIYFCIVTCSTVGYGDFTPKNWRTRTIVCVLIFVGLGAFGNFISLMSVARMEASAERFTDPSDLKGAVVLTQKGTTSVDYVKKLGGKPKQVDNIESACDWLLLKRGDAVVFDYPVLLNYVKENPEKVKMVAGMFDEQYYGFMLKKDSPLKKDVDLALLELYEDGTYKTLYDKWF